MDLGRRDLLKRISAISALAAAGVSGTSLASPPALLQLKGNINHAVSRWTYGHLSIEELCVLVKSIGFSAIDLVGPEDWPVLKKYGIDSSMCNGAEPNLEDGFIHPEHHDDLEQRYLKHIDLVADAGYTNLVCFSGNARGMSEQEGLQNAITGLKRVVPHAKKRGVVLQLELFNSKVDHPDYMADNSAWGIELCKAIDSPNFKLLYDIYHMQIEEGDIIRNIQNNHQFYGHYHTAGVPGRHEIDDTQELYYPAIAKAIVATGFEGYLAQEFVPAAKGNTAKAESLLNAIKICDV
ncbi:hydroxypyruvate isomerase family protein [Ningiella sp. W23]|uniref:hydroxypyruvate isomerase family protein n=1 Tax=Ningiella sp. W23 TaxID=3023715 RepID=UPI003757292D